MSDDVRTVALTGVVTAQRQSGIAFQVGGRVAQRLVEIGDHVEIGTTLAIIDSTSLALSVAAAETALAAAEARSRESEADLTRQQSLFDSGVISMSQLETAQRQTRASEAAVQTAQANVSLSRERLSYLTLKAEAAGTIVQTSAEVGQVVQAGQVVFTLAEDGGRDAVFNVFEAALSDYAPDMAVTFPASNGNPKMTGHLRVVAPLIDPTAGTVEVKVAIDNPPAGLTLGSAIVGAADVVSTDRFTVPKGALSRWAGQPAVWVVDASDNSAQPHAVGVERYTGDAVILSSGIKEGDLVVVAGQQFLSPGQVVEIAARTKP